LGQAKIKFEADTIKLDTVYFPVPDTSLSKYFGKKVNLGKARYSFQNTGDQPMIIQFIIDNGVGHCSFTEGIIKPGGNGFIEVNFFDDNYNEGEFLKYVTVDGNFIGKHKKIFIKGYKKEKITH
jgi:hypothetical protein